MPTPNASQDQFTGLRAGDINNILIAALNAVFDGNAGSLRLSARGAGNLSYGQVSIAATGLLGRMIASQRPTRRTITIKNAASSAISVFIGDSNVTPLTGLELKQGESIALDWLGAVWAVPASGTPTVAFIEVYD